ncbi:DNA methylase [Candidatus Parcubacteria bacterium]|nr:DNA methylase [Candidatus Parcubacteria bacterium]
MAQHHINASELGLDPPSGEEKQLFKWFLACFLFGKRIQQDIARKTWEVFIKHGRDTPAKICSCSWQKLVDLLGEGGYVRYDESTASYLQDICKKLEEDYSGKITDIYKASENKKDFEARLQELKGVGPKTVEIFMREVPSSWF